MGRPGLVGMAARTAVVAGTATAVSGNVQRRQASRAQDKYDQQQAEEMQQQEQAQAAQQPQQAQAAGGGDDLTTQLQQLATLHGQGILSDEEFSAAKAKLLT
jgi:hypothetical protein